MAVKDRTTTKGLQMFWSVDMAQDLPSLQVYRIFHLFLIRLKARNDKNMKNSQILYCIIAAVLPSLFHLCIYNSQKLQFWFTYQENVPQDSFSLNLFAQLTWQTLHKTACEYNGAEDRLFDLETSIWHVKAWLSFTLNV